MTYELTDNCTYNCTMYEFFEYESEEALICDFMAACNDANHADLNSFKFCAVEWEVSHFWNNTPHVEALDSYFTRNVITN